MSDIVSTGSSPRRIRINNVVAALQNLYLVGRMSRADLARRLGLNRSSSGQIVGELTQSGLVREVENTPAAKPTQRAGRPGILLELVPEAAYFIGIEIGVEHLSLVVIDLSGTVISSAKQPFQSAVTAPEETVAQAVKMAFAKFPQSDVARCQGVGVSAPMHIASDGRVALAPLIGWRDLDLVELVRAALPVDVPVLIENDANAFAIGDGYRHGAAGVTLFLVMEAGIGGGIAIDGKLFRGFHGLAGEIGHMQVASEPRANLEQCIGREVLVRRYRAQTGARDADLAGFLAGVRDREPSAVAIAEDWAQHLAFALVQACRLLDPGRIVLGGSMAMLYPLVSARVAAHIRAGHTVHFPTPEIAVDENAEVGSAFGAACQLHQHFLSAENETLIGSDALSA